MFILADVLYEYYIYIHIFITVHIYVYTVFLYIDVFMYMYTFLDAPLSPGCQSVVEHFNIYVYTYIHRPLDYISKKNIMT